MNWSEIQAIIDAEGLNENDVYFGIMKRGQKPERAISDARFEKWAAKISKCRTVNAVRKLEQDIMVEKMEGRMKLVNTELLAFRIGDRVNTLNKQDELIKAELEKMENETEVRGVWVENGVMKDRGRVVKVTEGRTKKMLANMARERLGIR